MSPNLELSNEEVSENNLTELFTMVFLAVRTSKDAAIKEVKGCISQGEEQRCKDVNPYLYSFWLDLHVRSGCLCVNQRVAIRNSMQDAVLESLPLTHLGSWESMQFGPYMHLEILNKAAKCKPCTEIGKNLEPVLPASKWSPLVSCSEPNKETQIDFGGPITSEKDQDIHFLA